MANKADKWYAIENLQQNDRFLIMFFQKYGTKIYEVLDKPKKIIKPVEWQPGKSGYTEEQKSKLNNILRTSKEDQDYGKTDSSFMRRSSNGMEIPITPRPQGF